ncbi:MAG: flagellar hook-basal body complex protein FliE [Anaerolineaceae bacterium]|nr:flagellar hook-basal body complex protein FliE [Anaerolineaceae bacterium]
MAILPITPASIPSISNIPSIPDLGSTQKTTAASTLDQAGKSFGDVLTSLSNSDQNANNLVQQLSMGQNVDIDQVMIGLQENDVNFQVAMGIRDKLVAAYNQVMNMQV